MSLHSGGGPFSAPASDRHQRSTLRKRSLRGRSRQSVNDALQLRTLLADLQLHIPRSIWDNMEQSIRLKANSFPGPPSTKVYTEFQGRLKHLRDSLDFLSHLADIETCQKNAVAIRKLRGLQHFILVTKLKTESILFHQLDAYPNETAGILRSVMELEKSSKVKLPHILSANFETLGVGRWLDDEVVNYLVTKWCSRSRTTLGFSTFFACKAIFLEDLCVHAKTGVLTVEDERRVQKWCRAAEKAQGLVCWERVFIPINENNVHWYSACINFVSRRIDVYDSLREVGFQNRRKPIQLRKNTNTMLVLMWLAEVLGRMRGEEIGLQNNPASPWRCDPHTEVPFQHNGYDCGVHMLWHLQHVVEFGSVQSSCESPRLRFSPDMIGPRLRLAQELLDDSRS